MNYTIKLKGGAKNDIPVLKPREIGICTDTNEVFVGTETGNKDFFKSINDKIGNGFTTENTVKSQMNSLTESVSNIKTKTGFSVTPPDGITIMESECYKKDDKVTFYLKLKRTDDSTFYTNNSIMFTIPSNLFKYSSSVNVVGLVSSVWKNVGTAVVSPASNKLIVYNNTEGVTQLLVTGEVIAL